MFKSCVKNCQYRIRQFSNYHCEAHNVVGPVYSVFTDVERLEENCRLSTRVVILPLRACCMSIEEAKVSLIKPVLRQKIPTERKHYRKQTTILSQLFEIGDDVVAS